LKGVRLSSKTQVSQNNPEEKIVRINYALVFSWNGWEYRRQDSGDGYTPKSLQFKYQGKYLKLLLPKKSVITLKFDKDLSQTE